MFWRNVCGATYAEAIRPVGQPGVIVLTALVDANTAPDPVSIPSGEPET
jgi:hypothetical protein